MGCDAEKLFPYEALQQQLKEFGSFAVPMSALVLRVLVSKPTDVPDLDELAQRERPKDWINPLANPLYVERMRGIIDDVVRLGFI